MGGAIVTSFGSGLSRSLFTLAAIVVCVMAAAALVALVGASLRGVLGGG